MISPTTQSIGLILSTTLERNTETRSSSADVASNALNCNSLEIYGEFVGNGEVVDLKVCKGGKVKGSLSYNSIVVEVGATIAGPMKPINKDQVLLIENK